MPTRKSRRRAPSSRQVAFTRFMLIVAFFVFWMLGISARLVHLQVTQHDWLREKAVDQRQDIKKTKLLRGTIFDRDNRPLAISMRAKTLYADPTEIEDIDAAAKLLAKQLKIDGVQLAAQLNEYKKLKRRYVPVLRRVSDRDAQEIDRKLEVPGVRKADTPLYEGLHWSEDQTRSYPYGALAAQVIGFANIDGEGMAGIEQSKEDLLHGAIIKKLEERDRLGRIYDETVFEREQPRDVQLTIATTLQYKVEQALENGVRAVNGRSGMAIAIAPRTGEILALANYPSFDPNDVGATPASYIANNAIQSVYSPGSVMKLVTYSAALEKGIVRPDDMIDAGNGTIEVARHKFSDSHHVGQVTVAQALAHSSNVCAIKTGLRVGKEDFFATLQGMGFGSKTGIELPAETAGIVRSPERWNGDSLASMSIGYEIGVTALQMATAFATIANDGVRVQPHIIKEIRMPEGSVVTSAQPSENRIVSADSARSMRSMLRQVVLSGTGKKAQLNGYTTAGKTGTAWKFDPVAKRVDPSKYIASFIGFAPADDPEVVIAVVVDEPKGPHDGGGAAAPIFRDIAAQILPELGVKPDGKLVADTQVANDITEEPGAADVPDKGEKRDNTAPKEDKKTAGTSSPRSARPAKPAKDDDKGKRGNSDAPKAGKLTAYLETIYGSPPISVLLET